MVLQNCRIRLIKKVTKNLLIFVSCMHDIAWSTYWQLVIKVLIILLRTTCFRYYLCEHKFAIHTDFTLSVDRVGDNKMLRMFPHPCCCVPSGFRFDILRYFSQLYACHLWLCCWAICVLDVHLSRAYHRRLSCVCFFVLTSEIHVCGNKGTPDEVCCSRYSNNVPKHVGIILN